jgi:hypothetical protein
MMMRSSVFSAFVLVLLLNIPTPDAWSRDNQGSTPEVVWLEILVPTDTYAADRLTFQWTAQTADWYRVIATVDDWVCAVWEHDEPESAVWMPLSIGMNVYVGGTSDACRRDGGPRTGSDAEPG